MTKYILPFLLVYALAGCEQGRRDFPNDEMMINHLESNLPEFEILISMFKNDGMTVVHPDWLQPKNKISNDRWNQYKKVFTHLKLDGGLRSWGGESIWFIGYSSGFVYGGSGKGYMYKPEDPTPLYDSLNTLPKDLSSNVRAYRFIREDWYLEYEWND